MRTKKTTLISDFINLKINQDFAFLAFFDFFFLAFLAALGFLSDIAAGSAAGVVAGAA